jgi:hypothetical protein
MDAKDSRERRAGETSAFLKQEQDASEHWTREERDQYMVEQRARIASLPAMPRGVVPRFPSLRTAAEARQSSSAAALPDISTYGIVAAMSSVDCSSSCHC